MSIWLEPRTAAVTRLVVEAARTKAFRRNILAVLRFTAELSLGWEPNYADSCRADKSPGHVTEILY